MLIDEFLKHYHFHEYHSIVVKGIPEKVYPLLLNTSINNSFVIRTLFRLRGMPVTGAVKDIEQMGFVKLGEALNKEILFGIVSNSGMFSDCIIKLSPEEFKMYSTERHVKAVINFRTDAAGENETKISTETRVLCNGRKIKNQFRIYWTFVSPFSRLIRKAMLKEIKKNVEKG
ncbi:MAG: hypothetical protein ABR502_06840 [Chitinophagaceae bacterium]